MYFLLASARKRFHYLSHGLGAVLIFVGLKMTIAPWYHVNTFVSLGVIMAILVAAMIFSEIRERRLQATGAPAPLPHDHDEV
jgi:tellurite resistance protein TerC